MAPSIDPATLPRLAEQLLEAKFSTQPRTVSHLLAALAALANNQFLVPAIVSAEEQTVTRSGPGGYICVHAGTALGGSIPGLSVAVRVLAEDEDDEGGGDAATATERTVLATRAGDSGTAFIADLAGLKLARGTRLVHITATPAKTEDGGKPYQLGSVLTEVTVAVPLALKQMQVTVRDGKFTVAHQQLSYADRSALEPGTALNARHTVAFELTLSVAGGAAAWAHQVFLRWTNDVSAQELFFVMELQKPGVYSLDMELAEAAEAAFASLSGEYRVDLITGDSAAEQATVWPLGVVKLELEYASIPAGAAVPTKPEIKPWLKDARDEGKLPGTVSSAGDLALAGGFASAVLIAAAMGGTALIRGRAAIEAEQPSPISTALATTLIGAVTIPLQHWLIQDITITTASVVALLTVNAYRA